MITPYKYSNFANQVWIIAMEENNQGASLPKEIYISKGSTSNSFMDGTNIYRH